MTNPSPEHGQFLPDSQEAKRLRELSIGAEVVATFVESCQGDEEVLGSYIKKVLTGAEDGGHSVEERMAVFAFCERVQQDEETDRVLRGVGDTILALQRQNMLLKNNLSTYRRTTLSTLDEAMFYARSGQYTTVDEKICGVVEGLNNNYTGVFVGWKDEQRKTVDGYINSYEDQKQRRANTNALGEYVKKPKDDVLAPFSEDDIHGVAHELSAMYTCSQETSRSLSTAIADSISTKDNVIEPMIDTVTTHTRAYAEDNMSIIVKLEPVVNDWIEEGRKILTRLTNGEGAFFIHNLIVLFAETLSVGVNIHEQQVVDKDTELTVIKQEIEQAIDRFRLSRERRAATTGNTTMILT